MWTTRRWTYRLVASSLCCTCSIALTRREQVSSAIFLAGLSVVVRSPSRRVVGTKRPTQMHARTHFIENIIIESERQQNWGGWWFVWLRFVPSSVLLFRVPPPPALEQYTIIILHSNQCTQAGTEAGVRLHYRRTTPGLGYVSNYKKIIGKSAIYPHPPTD